MSLIEVAPVKTAIFGKTYAELDGLEQTLGETGHRLYEEQIAAVRKSTEKAAADADPPLVIAKAIANALTSDKPKTKYLAGHGGKADRGRGSAPRPGAGPGARARARAPEAGVARVADETKGERVNAETKPRVLLVYYTLTKQTGRVADALAEAFEARGCDVVEGAHRVHRPAMGAEALGVPDEPSDPPDRRRFSRRSSATRPVRSAFLRRRSRATTTWSCSPLPPGGSRRACRSARISNRPRRRRCLNGKPFACASISRRYFSINLGQQKKLAEKDGGRWVDKTHFVCAGGQVKSMLAWLGYMKHGEPQKRVMGLKMYPPNLQARLRGAGESVRRRPRGQRSPAAGRRGCRKLTDN